MDQHDMLMESPFSMLHEDVQALQESETFTVLRSYLAAEAEYVLSTPLVISRPNG